MREHAQAELVGMGDERARNVLLTELEARAKCESKPTAYFVLIAQLPNLINLVTMGSRARHSGLRLALLGGAFFIMVAMMIVLWCNRGKWGVPISAERRALALALAKYDDMRVLPGLVALARLKPGTALSEDERKVIKESTRLVALHLGLPQSLPLDQEFLARLRAEIGALYPRKRRGRRILRQRVADFTEDQADLIATIAQLFALSPNKEDAELLRRMADADTQTISSFPNRRFVQEIAQVLRDGPLAPETTDPLRSLKPFTTVAAPVPQRIARS